MALSFSQDTEKLHEYTSTHVTVLFPWPHPLAFRRPLASFDWKACRPALTLPPVGISTSALATTTGDWHRRPMQPALPFDSVEADEVALRQYCGLVPPGVLSLVSRYAEHHWDLLVLASRAGRAAEDLMSSNPALAFMLASAWEFWAWPDRRPESAAREVWRPSQRQRQLLPMLKFPPREGLVRLLRKVPYESVSESHLLALRERLQDADVAPRLAHIPRVNANVLQMVADGTLCCVSPRLLAQAGERREDDRVPHLGNMLRDVVASVRRPASIPCFDDIDGIAQAHAAIPHRRPARRRAASGPLARAPFPGTGSIVPLTTVAALREEGRSQHNCVGSYGRSIAAGRVAVYRVLEPERATLSLRLGRRGWCLEQIKAARNRPVSAATRHAVCAWLDEEKERAEAAHDNDS